MTTTPVVPDLAFSAKALRTGEAAIGPLIATAMANPALINLAAGLVDPMTLPVEETAGIAQRILSDIPRARVALQYGMTLGSKALRERLLAHLETLEGKPAAAMSLTADDVVVTNGSQQSLYLMADVLLDPGDIVIAANPSYFVFTGTLKSMGAKVMTVPMDDDGMDVEAAGRLLERLSREGQLHRVKFIYCTTFYDNPTGLTLSMPRRRRLLELARQYSRSHRILIIEDAAYRELGYDAEALPSIKSLDEQNQYVALAQTFSKPFAPGIKLGYTFMPHKLMEAVLRQKDNHDFGSPNLCQEIALEALRDGSYGRHVQVLRKEYRRKRDAVLAALTRYMPEEIHWTKAHGGLYVWLTLPESLNAARESRLFQRAVERGVLYVPGAYCFQPCENGRIPTHHIRLSFGQVAYAQIEAGIERLAAAIRDEMEQAASCGCAGTVEMHPREAAAPAHKLQISGVGAAASPARSPA